VREMARCQGFPDNFVFDKTQSVSSHYLQIANAFSPPIAIQLGKCLLRSLIQKVSANADGISFTFSYPNFKNFPEQYSDSYLEEKLEELTPIKPMTGVDVDASSDREKLPKKRIKLSHRDGFEFSDDTPKFGRITLFEEEEMDEKEKEKEKKEKEKEKEKKEKEKEKEKEEKEEEEEKESAEVLRLLQQFLHEKRFLKTDLDALQKRITKLQKLFQTIDTKAKTLISHLFSSGE